MINELVLDFGHTVATNPPNDERQRQSAEEDALFGPVTYGCIAIQEGEHCYRRLNRQGHKIPRKRYAMLIWGPIWTFVYTEVEI